ncbi:hypothetical protein QAD02_008190 [Eretmocerus hayati]|uniref:Uncharacterized protein n=1 Tax=Eretmocerus hayati TaxID=131215 RepID=A0ACC2N733_9HYME|nr:hypothetical protein QAD02_008190 [Eretmocerus hayati]
MDVEVPTPPLTPETQEAGQGPVNIAPEDTTGEKPDFFLLFPHPADYKEAESVWERTQMEVKGSSLPQMCNLRALGSTNDRMTALQEWDKRVDVVTTRREFFGQGNNGPVARVGRSGPDTPVTDSGAEEKMVIQAPPSPASSEGATKAMTAGVAAININGSPKRPRDDAAEESHRRRVAGQRAEDERLSRIAEGARRAHAEYARRYEGEAYSLRREEERRYQEQPRVAPSHPRTRGIKSGFD